MRAMPCPTAASLPSLPRESKSTMHLEHAIPKHSLVLISAWQSKIPVAEWIRLQWIEFLSRFLRLKIPVRVLGWASPPFTEYSSNTEAGLRWIPRPVEAPLFAHFSHLTSRDSSLPQTNQKVHRPNPHRLMPSLSW